MALMLIDKQQVIDDADVAYTLLRSKSYMSSLMLKDANPVYRIRANDEMAKCDKLMRRVQSIVTSMIYERITPEEADDMIVVIVANI